MRRNLLMLAGLIALTWAVYSPANQLELVKYDDPVYLYNNPFIQQGLSRAGLHDAFFHFRFANWAPLVSLSYSLDENVFHLRPGPMHVENVVLHLMAGLLLWWFLALATGSIVRSWMVAALFLVHPMHVESVAWISERKDVLSTPLLIAAMICYVKFTRASGSFEHRRTGVWFFYIATLLLFLLSLMAKSMGVTLPAVLLLLDYWPLARWPGRSWLWLVLEKLPLMAASIAASILASLSQTQSGAAISLAGLSIVDRIDNALVCYVIYIVKLLVPTNLAVFYMHPGSRPMPVVFAAAVLLALISFFCLRAKSRYPYAIVGWLWFLGTLVPVIGIVQVGAAAMADRYSYFPSIGLFIMITWGSGDVFNRRLKFDRSVGDKLLAGLAAIVICIFAVVAHRQVWFWKNTTTLFTHALAVADESPLAHVALAQVAFDNHDIVKAVDECNAALKLQPYPWADFALGDIWLKDDPARAGAFYKKAVDLNPRSVAYRVGFARALRLSNQLDQAKMQAQTALDLDPDDTAAQEEMRNIQSTPPR